MAKAGGGLLVSADTAIEVMSLLASPSGHLANLSTAPGAAASETAEEVFAQHISEPVVQAKCVLCHTAGGVAGATRLHFEPASNPEHQALNLKTFEDFIEEVDDGAEYVLNKIQGVGHGGGVQVAAGTPEFTAMERFLALLGEEEVAPAVALTPHTLFDTVTMAPTRKTLRRAALIFAGRNPTAAEYAAAERGGAALRRTIRGLMRGPEFHEFLIRGANDRLLTDRDDGDVINRFARHFVDYTNEAYRRLKAARRRGNEREFWEWDDKVQHGARRAPVELIAHVVENDRPYTEILTADYVMANPWSARAYGASTRFRDPEDVHEFKPSQIMTYYRKGDGFEEEDDPVLGPRVIDPGPLSTDWPHAGVLNTMSFLRRYPTTATNRNRARLALDVLSLPRCRHREVRLAHHRPGRPRGHQQPDDAQSGLHRVPRHHGPRGRRVPELRRRGVLQGPVGWRGLAGRVLQGRRRRNVAYGPGRILAEPGDAVLVASAGGGDPDLAGTLRESCQLQRRWRRGGKRKGLSGPAEIGQCSRPDTREP